MASIDFIIKNISVITDHLDSKQLKQTLVEQFGRFKVLSKTDDFFAQHRVEGLDSWTKQEKNCFAHALHKNSHAEEIVKLYNKNVEDKGELKDKVEFLKTLSSITQLMKAHPYTESSFKSRIYDALVDWGFDGHKENIRLLKKSFNLYIDKPTIEDFIGSHSEKKSTALTFIKGVEKADKSKEMNCTLSTSMAGLISLGAMGALNPISGILNPVMTTVSNYLGTSPAVVMATSVAVMAFTFYKTFQTLNQAGKEIISSQRDKQISYTSPELMQDSAANSLLNKRILGDLLWKEKFDLSNKDNKSYLILSAFANERIKYPNTKITPEIAQEIGLNENQVKNLHKISKDRIHSLSLVSDPAIRRTLMLENTTKEQYFLLKNLSVMKEIAKTENTDGLYFKDASSITNLSPSLKKKIDKMDNIEKQIMVSFLQAQSNSSGACPPGLMKDIDKNLSGNNDVVKLITSEIKVKYENEKVEAPKNEELAYAKRLIKWVKMEEKMAVVNKATSEALNEIGAKYQFTEVDKVTVNNRSVVGKIKTVGDDVLSRIQNIRNGIHSIGRNNNLQP
jgi:hypothetical protein